MYAMIPPDQAGTHASDFKEERRDMLAEIAADAAETASYTGRSQFSERVMAALEKVARHRFVPPELAPRAYENRPLPIGFGQTISQPYIVALMTDMLELDPTDCVLEIGTGSGYQAAVLAELARRVFTVEIVEPHGNQARERLSALGYRNVEVSIGNGWQGWPAHAPYDAILVAAAPDKIPPALVEQLKPGGRMIIPLNDLSGIQQLTLAVKQPDGRLITRRVLPVSFVPFTGGQ
jgi:protein-L-isoaspartate(D-aspartate) O-methyltransferase